MTAPAAPRPVPAAEPGELARLTAAALTEAGFEVSGPDPDDADGRRFFISCPGGPYSLVVSDDAQAELQGDADDAHHAADIAAALLTPSPSDARRPAAARDQTLTFKGIAGMDLTAKGFDVALDIYTDNDYFEVSADIIVTSPGEPGTVHINDDGGLTWQRDLWPEHADTEGQGSQRFRWWLSDPAAVARDIADTITRALPAGISHDLPAAC
jgi:hypothetical protein